MTIRSWIAISLLILLTTLEVQARQLVEAADGDTITVRVSQTDLTRFRIEGGRIKRLMGVQNVADIHKDEERGEIALRPRVATPFSFFLTTNTGETFTVLATPVAIPSETVVIRPRLRDAEKHSPAGPATLPRIERIKRLMRAMLNQESRFYRVAEKTRVPLWRELELTRTARWPGSLIGEEYRVRNVSGSEQRLDEREFGALGKDVLAVAIERRILAPDAATRVYVVRERRE